MLAAHPGAIPIWCKRDGEHQLEQSSGEPQSPPIAPPKTPVAGPFFPQSTCPGSYPRILVVSAGDFLLATSRDPHARPWADVSGASLPTLVLSKHGAANAPGRKVVQGQHRSFSVQACS